jgi:hypothetical protein
MAFRVDITSSAFQDLDAILEWLIANEARETGLRRFSGMKEAVASFSNHPYRCPLASETEGLPFEVRFSSCMGVNGTRTGYYLRSKPTQ